MSKLNLITFTRLDYSLSQHVINISEEIAEHFKVRRDYVPEFCNLIKTSKRWKIGKVDHYLDRWTTMLSKQPGTKKIIDIVTRAFKGCLDNEEIDHLRGAMLEALIIACNGGISVLNQRNYGWGAQVTLNLQNKVHDIKYICGNPSKPGCANRSTVDFGSWDGYHGRFFECKAQPVGIGCKEISYMAHLKAQLANENISHEVFFVCADSRDEVKIKLEEYNLSPVFKPVGIEDLKTMMLT
ncbi:hypothetical protein [Metabacillus fastidiosus]|uniref:hypothetical protein n=1 Tax=Metabacillus fastidiosus TaxID=1458 RepID=UPI002E24B91B|nr:hypothetical protein [Metabacillus fastidiosus]